MFLNLSAVQRYGPNEDQFRYGVLTEEKFPNRIQRALRFRIVWQQSATVGWMIIFPFLFSAFSTQLQWLVVEPSEVSASSMISAILLIQNVVTSQGKLTQYSNIATKIIYLTYGITGIYIIAVAGMAFINIARNKGRQLFLVRYQNLILRYLRLFGLLLTPLFIPLLVIYTDKKSGQQMHYDALWYAVGFFCVATFLLFIAWDRWAAKKINQQEGLRLYSYKQLAGVKAVCHWSVEDVGQWIRYSEDLKENSTFTDSELEAIAEKFKDGKVDGAAFKKIATDAEHLVKYLGLAIGMALHFSAAIENLNETGALRFDATDHVKNDLSNEMNDNFHGSSQYIQALFPRYILIHVCALCSFIAAHHQLIGKLTFQVSCLVSA